MEQINATLVLNKLSTTLVDDSKKVWIIILKPQTATAHYKPQLLSLFNSPPHSPLASD